MPVAAVKRAFIFVVPLGLLVAAALLYPRIATLPPARRELLDLAPYLASAIGMFLAVHFHRGRPFAALLLLVLFYWCSRAWLVAGITPLVPWSIQLAFAFLLPLDFALIAAMRERGILTPAGRLRLAFLAGQALLAYWLLRHHLSDLEPYLVKQLVHLAVLDRLALPQPALLLAIASLIVVGILAARRQAPIDSGLLGAQLALLVAGALVTTPDLPVAFCTAGALIVTFAILQDSYNMAFRDDLTGIPSRRALNEGLHGIGRRYTIAMVDVDHFKKFNDTYGHDVGDQVLKMVARKLLAVGGGGKAYRYGGEEFTILFPGRRLADALPHLEELRTAIAGYRMQLRGDDRPKDSRTGQNRRGNSGGDGTVVSVTVSIGVAENGDGQTTPSEVIKSADKALYKAKKQGRNQVCR
ncbi:MAG TPA: GGDEF domain-containing protein [Geobacteraceae bacterium]